jgi:hypothetical protein
MLHSACQNPSGFAGVSFEGIEEDLWDSELRGKIGIRPMWMTSSCWEQCSHRIGVWFQGENHRRPSMSWRFGNRTVAEQIEALLSIITVSDWLLNY